MTKRAILFQVDPELAGPLRSVLAEASVPVETQMCQDAAELAALQAQWIFTANLSALERSVAGQTKVVVVSRLADTQTYLDAMERGAHDYCSPPFDRAHMDWLLRGS